MLVGNTGKNTAEQRVLHSFLLPVAVRDTVVETQSARLMPLFDAPFIPE